MIEGFRIDCGVERPEWPFMPMNVAAGSARTIGVVGLKSRFGAKITGCRVRVTNADGVQLVKDCVKVGGSFCVTFPASHFQNFGVVKNGVVVFAVGSDESGDEQLWIARVGDLIVRPLDASSSPGGVTEVPKDVYHKSSIVDGVQHYKREVLVWSERQKAWGADYVGDYVFVAGGYVPFSGDSENA